MADVALFSKKDGQRISDAVRHIERSPDYIRGNSSPYHTAKDNLLSVSVRNETSTSFAAGDFVVLTESVWIDPDVDEDAFRWNPVFLVGDAGVYSSGVSGSVDLGQLDYFYGVALDTLPNGVSTPTTGQAAVSGIFATHVTGECAVNDRVVPIAEKCCRKADQGPHLVLYVQAGTDYRWAIVLINYGGTDLCPYFWDFEIHGGLPTTGSQIWSVTLNSDTQNVTVDFDMTAAELKTHLLTQFTGLSSTDVTITGGPLPEVPLTVEWKNSFGNYASDNWPPTVGTNSLDNEGWMIVRQINPRV